MDGDTERLYAENHGESDCEEGVRGARGEREGGRRWRRPRLPDVVLAVYLVAYWGYLFLGAAFFSQIEGPLQELMAMQLKESREAFLKQYPCVSGVCMCVRERDRLRTVARILQHFHALPPLFPKALFKLT